MEDVELIPEEATEAINGGSGDFTFAAITSSYANDDGKQLGIEIPLY